MIFVIFLDSRTNVASLAEAWIEIDLDDIINIRMKGRLPRGGVD